jgi:hypothetical protein
MEMQYGGVDYVTTENVICQNMNRNFESVAENVKINLNEAKYCENCPNILNITYF